MQLVEVILFIKNCIKVYKYVCIFHLAMEKTPKINMTQDWKIQIKNLLHLKHSYHAIIKTDVIKIKD